MKKKRRLPELPFSFYFLSLLFLFVGWSGFSYIALNGPRVFMVRLLNFSKWVTFADLVLFCDPNFRVRVRRESTLIRARWSG